MKFDYLEPVTIEEAVSLLERYGDSAQVLAGGTDLVVQMKNRIIKPKYVISLRKIADLGCIENDGAGLRIGALATISSLEKHEEVKQRFPIVSQAAGLVSIAIRNTATVGGNLCTASPSADTPPALIALGATAHIIGPAGERKVLLEDFLLGPGETVLEESEIVTAIEIPPTSARAGGVYLKYAIKGSSDLAIVGVAVLLSLNGNSRVCEKARIVLGAVAPTPIRVRQAEIILEGKQIGEEEIEESARAAPAETQPISDTRASVEYRKEMTYVFTRHAIREALEQATN